MFGRSSVFAICSLIVLLLTEVIPGQTRQVIRIMPLGDSITWDITFGDTRPDGLRTGYRQPLWLALQADGFDVNFVGSLVAGQEAIPAFDPDNEGHSGWTDNQIAANIYNWLTANPADVILLHIGTNGLDASPADVANLLDEVDRFEADHSMPITVFIARIIQRVPYSATTTQFNDNVEAMALARVANQSDRIVMVDMEDGAGLVYTIDTSGVAGDMYDYLHPNSHGYQKMAAQWFASLRPFLLNGGCPSQLSHYWNLDETVGPPYLDSYASASAGCSNCPDPAAGIVNGCLLFSSSDSVLVSANSSFDWSATSDFTIELWCNPAASGGVSGLIGRASNSTYTAWSLGLTSGGKAQFHLQDSGNSIDLESSVSLIPGQWYHLAVSRSGLSTATQLYINGNLEASANAVFLQGFASITPITIGYVALQMGSHFQGRIDEIAVYDTTLAAADIVANYNAGLGGLGICDGAPAGALITSVPPLQAFVGDPFYYDVNASGNPAPQYSLTSAPLGMNIETVTGLINWTPAMAGIFNVSVAAGNFAGVDTQSFVIEVTQLPSCPSDLLHYWTLDESSGTVYSDQTGAASAVCSICPQPVPGIINIAKQFDRVDDAVNVSSDGSFNWSTSQSFSIEFWMKQSLGCAGLSQPNNEVIVGRSGAGWWIGVMCESGGNAGKLRCYFQGTDIISNATVTDGNWHHVVFLRDNAAGLWRLYLDGALDRSVSGGGLNLAASDPITLGWFNGPDPGKYRFGGVLDELALYDDRLPAVVIGQHYNLGLGASYCFTCGDIDGSGNVTISDAVYLISFIFGGGNPPLASEAADVDCSGFITISDVVYLIGYIFAGGDAPCQSCK